jgi:hypothetical protein
MVTAGCTGMSMLLKARRIRHPWRQHQDDDRKTHSKNRGQHARSQAATGAQSQALDARIDPDWV